MWGFASHATAGANRPKNDSFKRSPAASECSDDEISVKSTGDEALECPICWESFNIVENVPYVLSCGHTLCKHCVLGLQWAVVKLPSLPIQLPFFISCPWCNILSFRLVYNGNLKFPCKNFFLLWMVESMNGDRGKSHSSFSVDHEPVWPPNRSLTTGNQVGHASNRAPCLLHTDQMESNNCDVGRIHSCFNAERLLLYLRKSLTFFGHLTAKFPLVMAFLVIVLYAIPASAAILAMYIFVTIFFALPAFLVLYFAYPSLNWLVREILT